MSYVVFQDYVLLIPMLSPVLQFARVIYDPDRVLISVTVTLPTDNKQIAKQLHKRINKRGNARKVLISSGLDAA